MTDSWFVKVYLWRHHAPMIRIGDFSHKIDYITISQENPNLAGQQNGITCSRLTAILLNRWIFPIGRMDFGQIDIWQINYITIFQENLNLAGHQNHITGLRVTTIFLNEWIFPFRQSGEASRWRVCYQQGLPRLVCINFYNIFFSLNLIQSKSH